MAFGLSPKYNEDYPLGNLSKEQFLAVAIEAAKNLEWNLGFMSETGFLAYTKFSMSSWSEEVKVKIEDGNANIKSECNCNQMVDWGKNKENIHELICTINELREKISAEELDKKYEELKPNMASKDEDAISKPPTTTKEKLGGILSIFKPVDGYFITPIIINLNIGIFILMVFSGVSFILPDTESLLKWGANFQPLTLNGEWWRLITNCFLHIGIIHLLFNMYALLYIGLLLEPILGKGRFVTAYLLTGLTASVASIYWHDITVSAGASGAIFGMYGVFLALLTTKLIEKSARQALLASIVVFVGYNLLNGMKGGIDNAAHIGGLAGGLIMGYTMIPSLKKPQDSNIRYATIGILCAAVLAVCFFTCKNIPNDLGKYDTKIKQFTPLEAAALEVFALPKDAPKSQLLYGLKEKGIDNWYKALALVNELEALNLPEIIRDRDKMLKSYCELRIKSYRLLYKAVDENTDKYKDSLAIYDNQIEKIMTDMGVPPKDK